MSARLEKAKVDARLNTAPSPEEVKAMNADVVIIAVGVSQFIPNIPGIDSKKVVDAFIKHHQQ